ncbi:Calcipressin-2 [Fragariocoptes setiger]|uniref:Calcipressin-2 n=1 Tax=Fragariocoptes setiger TaxID=1670756 RepID=A0ABQ7S5H6_9ACAR|nr:Calcipressin-2 [Fragariocoptes setiger]
METAASALSATADGGSRYFAPDGPIQPALTAIAGAPMRLTELANSGITQLSNGLNTISHRAGHGEVKQMPGLSALSSMSSSLSSVKDALHSMIQQKNRAIMEQAHRGIESADRLRSSMDKGRMGMRNDMQESLHDASNMVSSTMHKTMGQLSQLSQKLNNGVEKIMNSASKSHGAMQDNMMSQTEQIVGTVRKGLERSVSNVQRTSEELMSDLDKGGNQNMKHGMGMMQDMQGHMMDAANLGQHVIGQLHNGVADVINQVQQVGQKKNQRKTKMENLITNLNDLCFSSDNNNFAMDFSDGNPTEADHDSKILIVTNLDSRVFSEQSLKDEFEAIFRHYDPNVIFRYLRSFKRVRLDFNDPNAAALALNQRAEYRFGSSVFKCYAAQIMKINNSPSIHLVPPKPERQFLISPPASPPVGWEPVHEGSPCMDIRILSAIANLAPGTAHELHPATDSQPGIVVEVCSRPLTPGAEMSEEESDYDTRNRRIPIGRTPRPF